MINMFDQMVMTSLLTKHIVCVIHDYTIEGTNCSHAVETTAQVSIQFLNFCMAMSIIHHYSRSNSYSFDA